MSIRLICQIATLTYSIIETNAIKHNNIYSNENIFHSFIKLKTLHNVFLNINLKTTGNSHPNTIPEPRP